MYCSRFDGKCVLEEFRSLDNWYTLTAPSYMCRKVNTNDTNLWHERLGHLNFKPLRSISTTGIVRGLPKLHKQSPCVCSPCQYGKQIKTTHKVI